MTVLISILFLIIASLYAAVGFGGGSGYLAVMGLLNISPEVMKPTSLTLNILVAGIAAYKYIRAGHFSGSLFWPIGAMSIPFAFVGGRLSLSETSYKPIVGLVLLYAAYRLFRSSSSSPAPLSRILPLWLALVAGSAIGLLSGLVGLGGGIFLSPLLLLAGWADTRQAMGISAAFVAVNSLAGLLGHLSGAAHMPDRLPLWLVVVGFGGWVGAEYGSKRLDSMHLRRLLASVLVISGARMVLI
jgi:uncharacterized membrane protein YfcA